MENLISIVLLALCCLFLYIRFCRKTKVKIIRAPRPEDVKRQRKKERQLRKIKRRFRIPYRGKTKIEEFDPKKPYIESIWEELKKH